MLRLSSRSRPKHEGTQARQFFGEIGFRASFTFFSKKQFKHGSLIMRAGSLKSSFVRSFRKISSKTNFSLFIVAFTFFPFFSGFMVFRFDRFIKMELVQSQPDRIEIVIGMQFLFVLSLPTNDSRCPTG